MERSGQRALAAGTKRRIITDGWAALNKWGAENFIERTGQRQERRYEYTGDPNTLNSRTGFNAINSVANIRLARLLGNPVTDALLATEARRLTRPLLLGTATCVLVVGALSAQTPNFWTAITLITIGIVTLSVGGILTGRRREDFADNLLRRDQPPIGAFHKTTRQKAFRRFGDTLPGIALSDHPHRQEILDALTDNDPETSEIIKDMSSEYYGTASELVATVKALQK